MNAHVPRKKRKIDNACKDDNWIAVDKFINEWSASCMRLAVLLHILHPSAKLDAAMLIMMMRFPIWHLPVSPSECCCNSSTAPADVPRKVHTIRFYKEVLRLHTRLASIQELYLLA